jgi:transcriptional regulator
MYVPRAFQEDRTEVLHAAMKSAGAATIVSQTPQGLIATHVPIELDAEPAPLGTIRCHFARANPHAQAIAGGQEVLIVFMGPEGYVTPSWYPTKQATGKVVPTWNFVTVHAYGTAASFAAPDRLRAHLSVLTKRFEAEQPFPWSIDDAPADFIARQCGAIIGFEIRLTRLEGKWKLSQNRSAEDRRGVIDGLRAQGDEGSRTLADLVEAADGAKSSEGR